MDKLIYLITLLLIKYLPIIRGENEYFPSLYTIDISPSDPEDFYYINYKYIEIYYSK